MKAKHISHLIASGLFLVPSLCLADWVLVEDFSGDLTAWAESNTVETGIGSISIVDDPFSEGNPVMEIFPGLQQESGTNNHRTWIRIPAIEYGKVGTLYFRIGIVNPVIDGQEVPAQVSPVWGVTPVDEPTSWGDYSSATFFGFANNFAVYDGGPQEDDPTRQKSYQTVLEDFTRNTWYEIWTLIRNIEDGQQDYQVYVKGPGFDESEPVLVYPTDPAVYSPFRLKPDGVLDPAGAALDVFAITHTTGNIESPRAIDPIFIDDIYMALDELTSSSPLDAGDEWAGFPLANADGDVNTEGFIGWINVSGDPWLWHYTLGKFIYLPESNVSESGAWTYVPGN